MLQPGAMSSATIAKSPPKLAPINSTGARVPPDVPDPSAIRQRNHLGQEQRSQRQKGQPASEDVVDHVVADAQRSRYHQPDSGEHE